KTLENGLPRLFSSANKLAPNPTSDGHGSSPGVTTEKDIRRMPYNPHAKTYFRPLEAALRSCNLSAHEEQILAEAAQSPTCQPHPCFLRWPCLRANTEKILDAIHNGEIGRASCR